MKKAVLGILIAGAIVIALGTGAVAGGALAYLALRTRPALAAELGVSPRQSGEVDPNTGVLVGSVVVDGPADQAGIVRGDIIQAMDGQPIATVSDLVDVLSNLEPGNSVQVTVLHGDILLDLTITLTDNQGQPYLGIQPVPDRFQNRSFTDQPDKRGFMLPMGGGPGALVTEVVENGPAAQAGLQVGDVISAVDGTEITADTSLADVIAGYAPGENVNLTITRTGASETQDLVATLGMNPEDSTKAYLGIRYRNLTENLIPGNGSQDMPFHQFPFQSPEGQPGQDEGGMPFFGPQGLPFQLPEGVTEGALVVEVVTGSPAAEAGLQTGDIITAVDGEPVSGPDALVSAVQSHTPGDRLDLTIYSSGADQASTVSVTLGENPNNAGQAYMGVRIGQLQIQMQSAPGTDSLFGPQNSLPMPETPVPFFGDEGQSGW